MLLAHTGPVYACAFICARRDTGALLSAVKTVVWLVVWGLTAL